MATRTIDFQPDPVETFDSAWEQFATLRSGCPVAHTDAMGSFWALTRYDDVKRASSDPATFVTSVQNVVPKVAFTGRRPPLHLDPPEHTPYRRTLTPLLSAERAEGLAGYARECVDRLLQPLVERGGGDICGEVSSYLPVQVFGEWMNVPDNWVERLHDSGRAFILAVNLNDPEAMKRTSLTLYDMARELIALRQEHPLDPATDITTALLANRDKGEPLDQELIVGMVRQVLVVGIVAPTVTLGSIAVHLSRDRALQDFLRANPDKIGAAVEEFLRLYTPYRGFARTAVHDVRFGDVTIPEREAIALVYASANRDDAVFPDGSSFVLDRPNIADHLAFGRGPHHCPGRHLGRMELRVMLQALLAATPGGFELAGEPVPARWPEIGAISVPLRFLP